MILIDSSFAVEWLMGTNRSKVCPVQGQTLAILPMQYAEVFVFFLKQGRDPLEITNQLASLEMISPEKMDLQQTAFLYLEARRKKSKASLADALLAAVAIRQGLRVAAFDDDFQDLGMTHKDGFWFPER